jgi:hypothetical protein
MAGTTAYEKFAWEDRFNRPTVRRLRAGLHGKPAELFDLLRRHLLELGGVTEGYAWRGDCWRWTIEYRTKLSEEPLAIVIPSPQDLQLAVPMERKFARSLAGRRMKRAVRDGVDLAQDPFDTRWGIWSIQAEGLLEDVVDLIELKLRHEAKQVG